MGHVQPRPCESGQGGMEPSERQQGPWMGSSGRVEAVASVRSPEAWLCQCAWGRSRRGQRGRGVERWRVGREGKRTRFWIQGSSVLQCPSATGAYPGGHRSPAREHHGHCLRYSVSGSQRTLPGPCPRGNQMSKPVGGWRGEEGWSEPRETHRPRPLALLPRAQAPPSLPLGPRAPPQPPPQTRPPQSPPQAQGHPPSLPLRPRALPQPPPRARAPSPSCPSGPGPSRNIQLPGGKAARGRWYWT